MSDTATKQPINPLSSDALMSLLESRFAEEEAAIAALIASRGVEAEDWATAIGRIDALISIIAALPPSESTLALKCRALLSIFADDLPWASENPSTSDQRLLRDILETLAARFGIKFPEARPTGDAA